METSSNTECLFSDIYGLLKKVIEVKYTINLRYFDELETPYSLETLQHRYLDWVPPDKPAAYIINLHIPNSSVFTSFQSFSNLSLFGDNWADFFFILRD